MNKVYEIKYEDKSIFFNGNLDYLFNAVHDPMSNTRDDSISLANFISEDKENIKKKRGRPKKDLNFRDIQRTPRGRPPKNKFTTTNISDKLLDMLRKCQVENGQDPEDNDKCLEHFNKLFEPFCIT